MTFLPDRITERDDLPDHLDRDFGRTTDRVRASTDALGISAASFAKAMSKAFADATAGGKKLDDVLRQLALRLSDRAVAQAFQPLARNLAGATFLAGLSARSWAHKAGEGVHQTRSA